MRSDSAHTEHVKIAVDMLEKKPEVYTMDPHGVDEILVSIRDISKMIGKEKEGNELVDSLSKRLEFVKNKTFEGKAKGGCDRMGGSIFYFRSLDSGND